MKPRTKLHHRIVDLASYLPTITKEAKQWAYQTTLEHRGYSTKNRVLCLDCGETFSPTLVSRKKAVCPHCETKLQVKSSRCTTDKQINYFAIADVLEEFQIIRNYELIAYYKKGVPVKYHLHEILQYWIDPDLKVTMFGKNHNTQSYCDCWSGNMEIRVENQRSWSGAKYDVYARYYHPSSVIKPEYKKFGIDTNLQGLTFIEAIKKVPRNSKLETLLKAKQYELLQMGDSYRLTSYWPSIKICLRNKYKVKDHRIYIDYLDFLKYFKKDLRNAKYVCPKNLMKAHDYWMKKKREILRLEEQERDRLAIIKRQENLKKASIEFLERNKKFFDLHFKKGLINIVPLKSIDEFKKEGDILNHCVFTSEYYSKKDSLILSARIRNKPIETIEIKLPSLKIEQSRGIGNEPTKYHDEILALLNKSIPDIRKIIIKTRKKSTKKHAA
ncbi:PcfJ domain-containing protein [uncultured Flavobacterium sp.]|uniref:PcfJ domain-containing protein n=1 Tax=uncultured Flavobacterium sp. TaxID=165435 RepID=UPI0030EB5F48|tara:strand:+ start:17814 stop:19139 length:1326 start_codon:yes stop_codon:yes gene_type:complete